MTGKGRERAEGIGIYLKGIFVMLGWMGLLPAFGMTIGMVKGTPKPTWYWLAILAACAIVGITSSISILVEISRPDPSREEPKSNEDDHV